METHRIKMKIGIHEFDAEGPKELVTTQFDAFMAAVSSMPKDAHAPPANPINTVKPGEASQGILDRVFSKGDPLSLAALPSGDNASENALLVLLYGYLKINGEQTVTGTMLNKAAKKSGVVVDRIDRAMSLHQPDFVLVAGAKKGRKYSLNNRGIVRAEEIVRTIVQ